MSPDDILTLQVVFYTKCKKRIYKNCLILDPPVPSEALDIHEKPPVIPHVCHRQKTFLLGLYRRVNVEQVSYIPATQSIFWSTSPVVFLRLPFQNPSWDPKVLHRDHMPKVSPPSLPNDQNPREASVFEGKTPSLLLMT